METCISTESRKSSAEEEEEKREGVSTLGYIYGPSTQIVGREEQDVKTTLVGTTPDMHLLPPGNDQAFLKAAHAQKEAPSKKITLPKSLVKFSQSVALPSPDVPATITEVHDEPTRETAFRRLSEVDRILLESLDIGHSRPRPTGRFLTMHKRRRKRLTTRSLTQEPGILDDIFHGLVQSVRSGFRVLERAENLFALRAAIQGLGTAGYVVTVSDVALRDPVSYKTRLLGRA
ncbi:hypothetical protein WN55_10078 [Dufourea novaeangliae]|uniref:Uncharacterized protein n=1 Tax=Dufourea novaeangliae TaxID=178035 RepID=A0A154P7S8_DUFNO|nr:hypothetical protein WN55_10078 [Dufourea novaeangliae]